MVTFSKCCGNEPYCSAKKDQTECTNGEVGLYCEWVDSDSDGKCVPKVDDRSDVCCRGGAVKDACHSIAYKLECPKDWLVTKGCCPDSTERKYNSILGGIPSDMDCCNSPCTQVEKAISNGATNCTLSSRCAPGPRSYAMTYDPYSTLGFFHQYRHGVPHSFGSIYHGGYDEEYFTDPFLGKTRSGGLLADVSLPDPDLYFHLLHGNGWRLPHSFNLENEFTNPLPIYNFPSATPDYGQLQAPPLGLYDLDSFDTNDIKDASRRHNRYRVPRPYGFSNYGHGRYGNPSYGFRAGYGSPHGNHHGGYGSSLKSHSRYGGPTGYWHSEFGSY